MATEQNIRFNRGADITLTVVLAPAQDITGWNLKFAVKQQFGDATEQITKTSAASQITITDATNGIFDITLLSADTSGLAPGPYVYDVQRTDSAQRTILTIGILNLLPSVGV